MSKKISFGAAVAFMAIIAAATFSITWIMAERNFNDKTHNLVEREKMYDKLAEVDDYVRQNYIGTITESALRVIMTPRPMPVRSRITATSMSRSV